MSKKTKTRFLTIGIILLGFLREYLFININWIYLTLVNGRMNGARHEFYTFLNWSPNELVQLKWILTILFSFLFFCMTYWIINTYFQNKQYNKTVLYVYIVLTFIAALLFLTGKLISFEKELYGVIRTITGIIQSFLPLMILVILFKFLPQSNQEQS